MAIVGVTQAHSGSRTSYSGRKNSPCKDPVAGGNRIHTRYKILRSEYGWDAERTEQVQKWAGPRSSRATRLC